MRKLLLIFLLSFVSVFGQWANYEGTLKTNWGISRTGSNFSWADSTLSLYRVGTPNTSFNFQLGDVRMYNTGWNTGWLGGGFFLGKNPTYTSTNRFLLEVDDIQVRKSLQVPELIVNRKSASNGDFVISNSGTVDSVYSVAGSDVILYANGDTIKTSDGNYLSDPRRVVVSFTDFTNQVSDADNNWGLVPFRVNDILISYEFRPSWEPGERFSFRSIMATVVRIDGALVTLSLKDATQSSVNVGDTFVRVGNWLDRARQDMIELVVNDAFSPYIVVRDGVSSYDLVGDISTVVTAMGRLDGFNTTTWGQLSGYGFYGKDNIYIENGRFSGNIIIGETSTSTDNLLALFNSGNLALKDLAEVSDLGATVIASGFLRADIMSADSMQTGFLSSEIIVADSIKAGTFRGLTMIGNVFKTSETGFRTELVNDVIKFYNASGDLSGSIRGGADYFTSTVIDYLSDIGSFNDIFATGYWVGFGNHEVINSSAQVHGLSFKENFSNGTILTNISSATDSGIWAATSSGGATTTQLKEVTLTFGDGQTVTFLQKP